MTEITASKMTSVNVIRPQVAPLMFTGKPHMSFYASEEMEHMKEALCGQVAMFNWRNNET